MHAQDHGMLKKTSPDTNLAGAAGQRSNVHDFSSAPSIAPSIEPVFKPTNLIKTFDEFDASCTQRRRARERRALQKWFRSKLGTSSNKLSLEQKELAALRVGSERIGGLSARRKKEGRKDHNRGLVSEHVHALEDSEETNTHSDDASDESPGNVLAKGGSELTNESETGKPPREAYPHSPANAATGCDVRVMWEELGKFLPGSPIRSLHVSGIDLQPVDVKALGSALAHLQDAVFPGS